MKKNLLIYIMLVFLMVVNVFFLVNYLGNDKNQQQLERKPPGAFLAKELDFDQGQKEAFRALTREHRRKMRGISDEIRELKDVFFQGLSDTSEHGMNIDSIAALIGNLEKEKDLEVYHHFEKVRELCNATQKEKFGKIIQDALRKGARAQGPPHGRRPERDRPGQFEDRNGVRLPPPGH